MDILVFSLALSSIRDAFAHPGPFRDADLERLYWNKRAAREQPQTTRTPPLRPRRAHAAD